MRSIAQPGPPAPERIQWAGARPRLFLRAASGPAAIGSRAPRFCGARICRRRSEMREGALGPFAYVMPALSKSGENAAFYSETFRPKGPTRLRTGAMTLGQRDRAPFSIAMRCGRARWPPRRRPYFARGDHRGRAVRGGRVRPRRRLVYGGARPRDQFQIVLTGLARDAGKTTSRALRCGCGRTRILPARWRHSAGNARLPVLDSMAASAASSAGALPTAAA